MLIVGLLSGSHMMAQTNPTYKLIKENGHFYFKTDVNGVDAKLMLESGVPGLMMSEAFYEANKEALNMEVKESDEKIRYLSGMHKVKYTAQTRLRIGDAVFEGPVKIVDGATDIKFPFHMLHHPSDSSTIVMIDLPRQEFSLLRKEQLPEFTKGATACDMTFNKWGMPVFTSRLSMKVEGRKANLEGEFIADMGNASLLFLNQSQALVDNMLARGAVTLREARDKTGNVVAEGLYASKLTICDRTFKGVSVGVARMKSLKECGFLGLKFFTMPTVFDIDNSKMYLCPR